MRLKAFEVQTALICPYLSMRCTATTNAQACPCEQRAAMMRSASVPASCTPVHGFVRQQPSAANDGSSCNSFATFSRSACPGPGMRLLQLKQGPQLSCTGLYEPALSIEPHRRARLQHIRAARTAAATTTPRRLFCERL